MGFALCALFRINCYRHSSERYSLKGRVIALGDMPPQTFEFFIGETSFEYSVDHLWLSYLSCDDWLAKRGIDRCSQIQVVFDTNSPNVEVIQCAVRLIYEQDVEEFNHEAEPSARWSVPEEILRKIFSYILLVTSLILFYFIFF